MEGLFTTILERGMAASFLVLAVVLLRLVFKKMPKWFRCVLWGLVAFRLVCPFSFESAFSLMPDVSRISEVLEERVLQEEESAATPEEELSLAGQENSDAHDVPLTGNETKDNVAGIGNIVDNTTDTGNIADNTAGSMTGNAAGATADIDMVQNSNADTNEEKLFADTQPVSPAEPTVTEPASPERKFTWQQMWQNPMPYLWLVGILLMVFYGVVSHFKVKHQVRISFNVKENIYYCDNIDTPFIFGMWKAGIYLPSSIEEATAEYVLRHEKEHLRRGDQWWKLLGFLLLAVYWFHPALWVAYVLFCKDIEFACDERVIKGLEESKRREYAQALLQCSIGKRVVLLCPTAFGENSVKSRIRSVMTYKKATIPVLIVAVLACLVVGILFLTDRRDAYGIERENLTLETEALDEKLAECIAEDIAELMVESKEGIYQLENFRFTFYELESEQAGRLLRVSVEADRTSLREPEDSPVIQGMKQAQAEFTYEAERNFAQTMIDSMLAQLKQEVETTICEPAIFVTLDEKNHYELYYGDANRTPLEDYFKKENAEKEQLLGYLTVYQRAGIQPPMDVVGSSGYVYSKALKNPETEIYYKWALYVFSPALYYKEGVYSYLERYEAEEKSELPWELLGEELGEAYSNHGMYWSERDALTECTGNGTLYAIKGYEDSYRVALCYGKTTYDVILLERMNDLWFHEGREVFQQRMHLENAVSVNGLSMEEELLWNFLAELFDATFIHPSSRSFPELNGVEHQSLKFRDALGFEHSLVLYEGGYVQETVNETKLVARIDEELCRQVMERIETYNIEQFEVSFEQAIPVEAILNQEKDYGEVYEEILSRVDLLTTSKNWKFFGEEGCYISRVPIQYYDVSEEVLSEEAVLILFSKDFSKAASMTLLRYEDAYRVILSYTWNSSIQKEMQARPEEEFIFLYSLKSGLTSSVMTSGELMLDAQSEVCYAYPQGDYYLENNLYQKLYSDELAVSYEELTAEENLIWISAEAVAATPTPTPVDTSNRSYQKEYESYSYAAYPAEEWMKTGWLEVPFTREDMLSMQNVYERFAMYYIPEEARSAATTADLLRVACEWPFAEYDLYNYPSYYLNFISEKFNGVDELFQREDFASDLLKEYEAAGFYVASGRTAGTSVEEYKKEAAAKENAIVLMEIFLATNAVYDQLTNNERAMVMQAVSEKMMMRKSGLCLADEKVSGFFAYVKENSLLGNKWYDYIMDDGYAGWTSYLDNAAYPNDHVPVTPLTVADAETLQPIVFGEDEVLKTMQLPLAEKEYTLQVIGKRRLDMGNMCGVREIRVYAGTELIQTVQMQEGIEADGVDGIDSGYTQCFTAEDLVVLKDINFDGYPDLEVFGWITNSNIPYYYWCWNQETEQFDYAFCFQITGTDEERQLLIAFHHAGGVYDVAYFTDYYRVTGEHKLELVESETKVSPFNGYRGWQEAYRDLIYYFPNNLANPYYLRADTKWHTKEKYVYLGIHDFNSDGTPELIMGDEASLAVFTYKNGNVEKLTDIIMECCWECVSGVAFHDNTILISDHGSDGSGYVAWSYQNGAWTTAVYCEYHPQQCTINGEPATYEEFCNRIPFDPEDWEGSIRPYRMEKNKTVKKSDICYLEQDTELLPLDETFDFELIRWTED